MEWEHSQTHASLANCTDELPLSKPAVARCRSAPVFLEHPGSRHPARASLSPIRRQAARCRLAPVVLQHPRKSRPCKDATLANLGAARPVLVGPRFLPHPRKACTIMQGRRPRQFGGGPPSAIRSQSAHVFLEHPGSRHPARASLSPIRRGSCLLCSATSSGRSPAFASAFPTLLQ